jgi:thiol-disulfide isomerase/thioredoxin
MKKQKLICYALLTAILQAATAAPNETAAVNTTRPNSFVIQSAQAGSTTEIDNLKITDLDSGSVVYENTFSSPEDATRGLRSYYWPEGGKDNENFELNGAKTRVEDGRLILEATGFNQNGNGGYESHSEAQFSEKLPVNFRVEFTARRLQWPGHFHFMLYRQEPEDAAGAYTLGGAFSGKRPNNKPLDIIRVAASGSWFQELGIMTNLGTPKEKLAQKFPAPSGSLGDTHQLAVELRNNKVSFFMDNVLLNDTLVAGWEVGNGSKVTMPTAAPAVSATTADAPPQQPAPKGQADKSRQWSPEQATGVPDTNKAGDLPTAWASMNPDAGPEWLEVEFAKPVEIAEVRIRETFNPGAINKVEAISADNKGTVIWEGTAEAKPAPSDMVVKPQSAVVSNKIKIHLDTTRVPGWNEIDAVELLGKDGSRQWAQAATASTTYADAQPQQPAPKIQQAAQPQQYNLQELIGENLVDAEGKPVDPMSLKGKMVGIYFSAQWCPPCRLFTPKLVEFRNKIAKDFEVVFVSSDRDEASMRAYMKEAGMPWPALPFGLEKKAALTKTFEVRGIPSLIVLNDRGIRISGNSRNDVASLEPEAALSKWKKNAVEPITTNPQNSCRHVISERPIYEGDQVIPPKDLTINPGQSIFGCPYGATEKEVIDILGQPIGKAYKNDKSFSIIYGNDTELIFKDEKLDGVVIKDGIDFLDRNQPMSFSKSIQNKDKKSITGGWRLPNGLQHGMELGEALKIPGIKTDEESWRIEYTQNDQLIKITLAQKYDNNKLIKYINQLTITPQGSTQELKKEYLNPFNIPTDPAKSIFGCDLGSNRQEVEKKLGKPIAEYFLGKNKLALLYNQNRYLLIFRDDKLEGGIFRSGDYHGLQNRVPQEIFLPAKRRSEKTTSETKPFTLRNGIGLLQPLAYAKGILGERLKGETYTDEPSLITLRSARFHSSPDDADIQEFDITRALIIEIRIEPINK